MLLMNFFLWFPSRSLLYINAAEWLMTTVFNRKYPVHSGLNGFVFNLLKTCLILFAVVIIRSNGDHSIYMKIPNSKSVVRFVVYTLFKCIFYCVFQSFLFSLGARIWKYFFLWKRAVFLFREYDCGQPADNHDVHNYYRLCCCRSLCHRRSEYRGYLLCKALQQYEIPPGNPECKQLRHRSEVSAGHLASFERRLLPRLLLCNACPACFTCRRLLGVLRSSFCYSICDPLRAPQGSLN